MIFLVNSRVQNTRSVWKQWWLTYFILCKFFFCLCKNLVFFSIQYNILMESINNWEEFLILFIIWASLVARMVKNMLAMPVTRAQSLGLEVPLEYPLLYSRLENLHGHRNMMGCSPWGCKESGTTEQLSMHTQEMHIYFYLAMNSN